VGKVSRELLERRWVHAHEEDSEGEMVFRPAGYDLPPSRGRSAFELRPDGRFVEDAIGAADVPEEASGTWELDDEDRIVLRGGSPSGVPREMKVTSAEPDRLTVER
jgi:hypothetical protein